MRKILYYVATSIDGYISGPDEDVRMFTADGDGINQYLADLKEFDTVIMGRKTYEFGYKFGLKPGQLAYPHMKHLIFSDTLKFEKPDKNLEVRELDIKIIEELQKEDGSDIYLCGGGALAGWLLDHEKIDILKIKLNPIILGDGVRIFGKSDKPIYLELLNTACYNDELHIITYKIKYD
jgi:dihydrofolate reductase